MSLQQQIRELKGLLIEKIDEKNALELDATNYLAMIVAKTHTYIEDFKDVDTASIKRAAENYHDTVEKIKEIEKSIDKIQRELGNK